MLSVNQRMVSTSRLQVATLEEGDPEKPVVILLHGNVSSNVFWRDRDAIRNPSP